MTEIALESLVGEHELSGVDMTAEDMPGYFEGETYHGNVCRFVLDGRTYTAAEDDNDGYRSALKNLIEGGEVKNTFAPQRVLCSHKTESEEYGYRQSEDILVMRDLVTGEVVLEVGTTNTGDYYPGFVANFQPQNMACNRK